MKKFILSVLLIFVSGFSFALNITFTNDGRIIAQTDNDFKTMIQLKQSDDGMLKLDASPAIGFKIEDVYFGEISLTNWKITKPSTLSLSPVLCGFTFKTDNASFIVSNPVFCPSSEKAAGTIIEEGSTTFGIVYHSVKKDYDQDKLDWQLDWKDKIKDDRLDFLIKDEAEKSINKHTIKTLVAIDGTYRFQTGFTAKETIDLSIERNPVAIEFKHITNASKEYFVSLELSKAIKASVDILYDKTSIYGGSSQGGNVTFTVETEFRNLTFIAESEDFYKQSTGKEKSTFYEIKYIADDFFTITAKAEYVRTKGSENGIDNISIDFKSDTVNAYYKNNKALVTLKYKTYVGKSTLGISFTSNRKATISLSSEL